MNQSENFHEQLYTEEDVLRYCSAFQSIAEASILWLDNSGTILQMNLIGVHYLGGSAIGDHITHLPFVDNFVGTKYIRQAIENGLEGITTHLSLPDFNKENQEPFISFSCLPQRVVSKIAGLVVVLYHEVENNKLSLGKHNFFELFLDNCPMPAWLAGNDYRLHYINRKFKEIFNLGDACPFYLSSVFLPHYLDNCDENIKLVIQEGEITEMINDDYNPSGNKRVFRMYKFPMVMEKGGDLKAGWMMDITTLMDTEQALNESNERYRFACKASSDVIWEWDVTGESITIGEGYEFLLGYKKSNNVNTLLSHIHPDDLAGVKEAIQQSIHQKEKQWQLEYRYICASGEVKNCINRGFLIWDNASKLVKIIGALQDVTPYKVLQQQLLQEQETRECSIIEAMFEGQETERQHIGIELHDNINQLLVTVLLLLKSYRISPDQGDLIIPKSIDILTDALQEIRKLTHQLIVPTFTDTSFSETISEIVHSLTLAGIKEVSVELHQNCCLEKLDGPLKLHLYRILQEGVSNIIKYANAKHVNISIKVSGNSLLLRVKDDGVGFDLQEKRKGIGLKNICSRVKLHAGNVQINAAKNQGCELIVHIPLS